MAASAAALDCHANTGHSTIAATQTLHYFAPQLVDMQRTFEGNSYQSFDVIRKKTENFLAGYYSHLERGGALIPVKSVPMDWSPRYFRLGWVDESIFES